MLDDRAKAAAPVLAALEGKTGAAFVVLGDAGIGKSTLVGGVIDTARERGVAVVSTRWSGDPDAPPLWSWTLLARNWLTHIGPADRLAEAHPLVRRLVPDDATALGLDVPDAPADERSARLATGDGLGRLMARGAPALVVLEDLHHAPSGGLGFLESFAAAALDGPVVVLATSRDLASASGLTSLPQTQRVELRPLTATDAEALVRALAPSLRTNAVADVVARAEGNPFFLSELTRLALSSDTSTTTEAVRDVVMRRIDGLGPRARDVLGAAALLGRKPALDLLYRTVDDDAACDQVLDDAEAARLIELDGVVMRWNHDLVRESVVESLRSHEARRVHARIATALVGDAFPDTFATAHHLLASGATTAEAADLGEAAAVLAANGGAREDALGWIDRVLAFADRLRDGAERSRRLDLLAGSCLVSLNEHAAGKVRLVRCAERSLSAGDATTAAHALLTIGGERLSGSDESEPPIALVEQALALVDADDLRIRLLGRSSDLIADRAAAFAVAQRATEAARAARNGNLIILALTRELICWRATELENRRSILTEIERWAPTSDPEHQFEAQAIRIAVLLEEGELEAASRLVPVINATVLRIGLPSGVAFHSTAALIHLLQGRFDDDERIMAELVAATEPAAAMEAMARQASHQGLVGILRGDPGDFLALARVFLQMTAGTPDALRVHGFVALAGALTGDRDAAVQSIDEVFRLGLDELHNLHFGQASVYAGLLAEATCVLEDHERTAALEAFLLPYGGRVLVGGMAPLLTWGAADHILALCAHLRGDLATARARVDAAILLHEHMGAGPFVARSRLLSAEIANDESSTARAVDDARQAAKLAARYGMRLVSERAAFLLALHGAAPVRGARVGGAPLAIVFTDIESSTATAAALGDDAWMQRLREHDTTVRKLVAEFGGREVKHLGDGFMLTFPSAVAAVDFGRALQVAFANSVVRVRAGVHVGTVTEEDGDVFGTTVNIAARVSAAATGGETLVSDDVLVLVPNAPVSEAREAMLKGVVEPMRLHPLVNT